MGVVEGAAVGLAAEDVCCQDEDDAAGGTDDVRDGGDTENVDPACAADCKGAAADEFDGRVGADTSSSAGAN